MFKKILTATRISTAILLVVSVFTPATIQSAGATGNITKAITVLGVDGNPYEGASVALAYLNDSGSLDASKTSPIAITNSSGVATVTFPDTAAQGAIYIQPKVEDISIAAYSNFTVDHANGEPFTAQLEAASLAVSVTGVTGQPALVGGGISNGYRNWFQFVRTGATGIAIPSSATAGVCKEFRANPVDIEANSFVHVYASKVTGSGDSREVKLFTDPGTCANEASKTNGIYQLAFNAGNISGTLLSNSGQPLEINSSKGYEINSNQVDSDGVRVDGGQGSWGFVPANGTWSSLVDTTNPGRYEITFSGFGSDDYPSFGGVYVYVTSDHKLSLNSDGSNSADTLIRNVNIPLPNLKIAYIESPTAISKPAYYNLAKFVGGNFTDSTYANQSNGVASFTLTADTNRINIWPALGGNSFELTATLNNGEVSLANSDNVTLTPVNGIYYIYQAPSNTFVRLQDASGNPTAGSIDFCTGNGPCSHIDVAQNGLGDTFLSDNTFEFIQASSQSTSLASTRTSGVFTGGVLTVEGISKVDGVWVFTLPTANLLLNVTNPVTGEPISGGYINFENADSNWNPTAYVINADISGLHPGLAKAALADGTYLMTVNGFNQGDTAGLAAKTYRLTMVSGVASVYENSTPISAVGGKFPLTLSSSNFEITVNNLTGQPLTNGSVDFCADLGGGNTGNCRGFGLGGNGQSSQYLADGNWLVTVRPGNGVISMASRTYSVSVSGGVVTVSGASEVNGRWILTGRAPNISGSFTVSSGSLTFGNNRGVSLNLQKYNNGNWEWQSQGSWFSSTGWALNISSAGRYRLVANPYNLGDYVQSYSAEFWVDGSSKVSATVDGTYSNALIDLAILLKSPNLKLTLTNPNDGTLLPSGWVSIMKITGQNRNWIANADINSSTPGTTGANLTEAGEYVLVVNPPNGNNAIVGLAPREYQLTVSAGETMSVTSNGIAVQVSDGRFILSPAAANVTARVLRADGTPFVQSNGIWVNASMQKFNTNNNNWEWVGSGSNGDQNGYVSLRVESAGKYRLRIEPNGDPAATVTYSSEFSVAEEDLVSLKKEFGSITLAGPSVRISVAAPANSSTALSFASVEIRKDGYWVDWVNTSQNGVAGVSLATEGTYEFVVHPTQDLQGSNSRKSYKVVATKNSDGLIEATVVAGTGVSTGNGVTTLLLGLPTLSGVVNGPSGNTPQQNSQVYAVDISTNRELWEFSTNTSVTGTWAMALPAGTYKIYARAPWGTSQYGNSEGIGNVVVDASGAATSLPAGQSSSSFSIRLKAPNWSGVVKNPAGTAVIAQARVCLRLNEIYNCVNADANGAWALSAPTGFTNFTSTNPYLEINDDFTRQYPQKRFDGITAVTNAIGTSGSGITLNFEEPNTRITVTAGGVPVANVWVTAERDNSGFLGGGSTDANGVAKLNISDPTTAFRVRVDLNGNQQVSTSYTSTMKSYSASEITTGRNGTSIFSASIALSEPNFKFALFEPSTDGSNGNLVPYAWVELFNESTGTWLGGSSTDANGFASFKLDVPQTGINKFVITANPQWNSSSNFSRQAYAVSVNTASVITVVNKTSTIAVTQQSVSGRSVYPISLGNPSVTGIVVDPNGNTVANSWVVPIDAQTSEYLWQQGTNSKNNGALALTLAAGSYKLEANVPWGSTNTAKSAQCSVTVAGGTITSGGGCVVAGTPKTVRLELRAPNLTFTLKIDGSVVANANVGISAGKWSTNAQSNAQGQVSLYVDAAAIRSVNGWTTSQPLNVWVDPPYGTSDMARWDCQSGQSKPICSGLVNIPATGDYPETALGDVTGVSPNTRIKIVLPGTSTELPNSWVVIYSFDPAHPEYGQRWLGGGNSGANGFVSMNLDTSTVPSNYKFMVEVNAPWNQRQMYASKSYNNSGSGYTWSALTALTNLSPAAPNLVVTVSTSDAVANKFGWIGVEEVDSANNNWISWVGGYGLNENGVSAIYLAPTKRYRITAYPGSGRSGARTTCLVDSASSVIEVVGNCPLGAFTSGAVTISLAGGNVVGRVKRADNSVVVGAIVYANEVGAASEATAVITATNAEGLYGLQLDNTNGKRWNIKVFPVGSDDNALRAAPVTDIAAPSTGSSTYDFTLRTA